MRQLTEIEILPKIKQFQKITIITMWEGDSVSRTVYSPDKSVLQCNVIVKKNIGEIFYLYSELP